MNPVPSLSELLALAVVALVLGMRHGVDADHLAAIDAMTRCNADARPALARRTGLWFSIGHGAVVLAVAFAVALSRPCVGRARLAASPSAPGRRSRMLALLGTLNLVAWRRTAPGATVAPAGWRSRLFEGALRACSRRAVIGVGVLFAASFDTVSQAALMAATGAASQGLARGGAAGGRLRGGHDPGRRPQRLVGRAPDPAPGRGFGARVARDVRGHQRHQPGHRGAGRGGAAVIGAWRAGPRRMRRCWRWRSSRWSARASCSGWRWRGAGHAAA